MTGLQKLSIDKLPPIVSRGVLIDMAKHMNRETFELPQDFNSAEIKAAAKAQRVKIRKGDVVLFHTGWLNVMDSDPVKFMAGQPGLGVDGAKYLAEQGVVAVGADTWALEVLPGEVEGELFPVHPELLAKNGVYILAPTPTLSVATPIADRFIFNTIAIIVI